MTTLAAVQDAMLALIVDEDRPLPGNWTERHAAGLAIYRNNYRSALVDALRSTFERTERLVGEASFARAAAHHLIMHPPSSWTLDRAGDGFAATCGDLFANDPEVAELAWLEWAMHCAFVARDTAAFGIAEFTAATSGFGEDDWSALRLRFVPAVATCAVRYDLKRLWSSLAGGQDEPIIVRLDEPARAIVWREGERPVFLILPEAEGAALDVMTGGAGYGEACALLVERLGEDRAIAAAGAMLSRWLAEGMVEGVA